MIANKRYNQLTRRIDVIISETKAETTEIFGGITSHSERVEFILDRFRYYGINEYPNERRDAGKIANTVMLQIAQYKVRHNLI